MKFMEEKDYKKNSGNKLNIVNFDKSKKYKITRKQVIITITSGILALLIAITSGAIGRKIEIDKNNQQIIEQFYDSEELEQRVRSYLQISEELNDLKLNKYELNDDLFIQYGVQNELKSPGELNELINQFKESSNSFDKYNLVENNNKTQLILTLKKQEDLVNSYIYNTGYDVAYYDISKATKEMAAEAYGLNPNDITFNYDSFDGNDANIVHMEVKDPNTGYTRVYRVKDKLSNDIDDKIIEGVKMMVNTDSNLDKDEKDNSLYNELRNKRIENALEASALYMHDVNTSDLYNEDLNEDFNKKSNRRY